MSNAIPMVSTMKTAIEYTQKETGIKIFQYKEQTNTKDSNAEKEGRKSVMVYRKQIPNAISLSSFISSYCKYKWIKLSSQRTEIGRVDRIT